jgi:sulfite reductase beta subunit-like hemoprotein
MHAQSQPPATGSLPRHVLSINPFLPLAGYFQGEFETKLKENVSVAVSGAHARLDDYYTSLDVKLRLYPQERGLEGFGIAAGGGFGRIREDSYTDAVACIALAGVVCPEASRRSVSGATFSVEAHYQFLLGRSRKTSVAFGGGAKRYFIEERTNESFQRLVPTLRLTVGYAF